MKQYAVIGLGKFGYKVAVTLAERGGEVIAIDSDQRKVEEIKDLVAQAVCLDSTDEAAMKAIGISEVDVAVVAIGDDREASILTTGMLKRIGVGKIIARATSDLHAQILELIGAHKVISIEDQMGEQLARSIIAPDILEHITLGSGHSLAEIIPRREFVGKSLREINLRAKYGVHVVAIRRKIPAIDEHGENKFEIEVRDFPGPDDVIEENDILVVVGDDKSIESLTAGAEV